MLNIQFPTKNRSMSDIYLQFHSLHFSHVDLSIIYSLQVSMIIFSFIYPTVGALLQWSMKKLNSLVLLCLWRGACQQPTGGELRDSIQLPCGFPASGLEDVIIQDQVFGPAEETPTPHPQIFQKIFIKITATKKWHCIILLYLDTVSSTVSCGI